LADNIDVTPGTGATISTDEGAGGHVQRVKLALSADGSETHIPADANGLLVNLGTNNDVTVTGTVDLGATDNAVLDNIDADLTTVIGHVDGIEGLLTTIDADTSNLSVVGGGTEAAAIRVTIANNSTGVLSVDDNGGALTVDNGGTFATQVTSLPASTNTIEVVGDAAHDAAAAGNPVLIGAEMDETSTDAVDEGDVGRLRITANRLLVTTMRPDATGEGLSKVRNVDIDETEDAVKASAGKLYGYHLTNSHASAFRYVKFYNATTANVTVGTTTPVITVGLPPMGGATMELSNGDVFDTAITIAATTGVADNDTGAPGANEVHGTVWYL
jgi:hypothetical protein